MTEPTKVLIFTGAGLGVPLGLPTSTDFGDDVTAGGAQITKSAIGFLHGSVAAKDIERILATLESFKGESSFIEHILSTLGLGLTHPPGGPSPQQRLAALKAEARNEIVRIKKLIFAKLGHYDHAKAGILYRGLLAELRSRYPIVAISIITTNYDLTFENTLEEQKDVRAAFGIDDVDYGFSIKFGRPVYDPTSDFGWKPEKLEFLKVHGSLDWHRDERDQCGRSGSKTVPDNPDQMAILYPGFKGVPEREPFTSLHARLSTRLLEAHSVFVLGFAFRDAYINSIFENVLRARRDLHVHYFNPLPMKDQPKESMAPRFAREFTNFKHIEKAVDATDSPLGLASLPGP